MVKDIYFEWSENHKKLQESNTQKGALTKVLLPARILEKRLYDEYGRKIEIFVSGVVMKNKKSSGECDLIITRKGKKSSERENYGIFRNKVPVIIEWERRLPSRNSLKNKGKYSYYGKIGEKLACASKALFIFACDDKEGSKVYEKKKQLLRDFARKSSPKVEVFAFNNKGFSQMRKELDRILKI